MSGFKVNFSVNNQLATPSMHAAALANRPAAGQPGRVFIDTDNPSTGIYRDTGTVWVQIAETATSDVDTLQNVTDNGNSTTNNIILQYPDNAQDNALVFYNTDLAQEEYLIRKRATGILTNDVLSIESRGNISPSTDPVGLLIDGSQNVIRSFFGSSFQTKGISLDFTNNIYRLGNVTGTAGQRGIYLDANGHFAVGSDSVAASAVGQFNSTTKGFLIPRMTAAQAEAIVSPAEGLQIYSTTATGTTINQIGLWQYNSGSWQNTAIKNDIRKQIWKYANTWEYFTDFVQPSDGWNGNNSGAGTYANDGNFQVGQDAFWNGVAFSTGTTSTGRSAGYYGFGQSGNLGVIKGVDNDITDFYCIGCVVTTLSTVLDEYVTKFGLGGTGSTATEKFIGFKYDRLNYGDFWVLELNDTGTFYTVVTNTPVVANTLYTFRVLITNWNNGIAGSGSSSIRGWINGTEVVATSGTYPIPTAPIYNGNTTGAGRFYPQHGIWKSAGNNARIIYIDGWYIYRNFITNRFTAL
jgi:hypothetical protein